ncbi:MAG: MutS-related protein, partial [Planctomycetota bacterium]
TGPNMAGKSTYIRQVALVVLMAQMGSYIPARKAHVGLVDAIFTRVGASDELARGRSTFMVEMTETAYILNTATTKSLVVFDEVGRGTGTFDGLSIAWAVCEFVVKKLRCRTLFATHYHQLTGLSQMYDGVVNRNIAVREWQDKIVFLHKIVEGGTDKSYGIHVARLAGVPDAVIERSRAILSSLEEEALELEEKLTSYGDAADHRQLMLNLFGSTSKKIVEPLKEVDLDKLSGDQALAMLRKLKDAAE